MPHSSAAAGSNQSMPLVLLHWWLHSSDAAPGMHLRLPQHGTPCVRLPQLQQLQHNLQRVRRVGGAGRNSQA